MSWYREADSPVAIGKPQSSISICILGSPADNYSQLPGTNHTQEEKLCRL